MVPASTAAREDYRHPGDEVLEWTAAEAVERIRSGSISAESYASRLLQQYRATKDLNAITWLDENRILEAARRVDMARSKGQTLGPLAGLPLVIKDNINTVGFPTTGGTPTLKGYLPQRDAVVADILFKAGAILLGKANMHELGRGVTNSNPAFGFAKNPYDPTRVPGGGAGGTAAAIAARITPAGLGSDTAGSSRMPAALCGIAGMRPSTAGITRRWPLGSWMVTTPMDGVLPISYAITTPAPMGRTVSDVGLLDAVIRGVAPPVAVSLRGSRIGVPRGFYWEDLDPEVGRLSERALERLRSEGAVLIDVDLRGWAKTANETFFTIASMNNLQDLGNFLALNVPGVTLNDVVAGTVSKDVRALLQGQIDHPIPLEKAEQAMRSRRDLALQYEDVFRRYDISALIYPTLPVLAPLIRPGGDQVTDTIDLNGKQVPEFGTLLRNTNLSGVIGIPSLSVPVGLSSNGLPVGVSLSGLSDHDTRILGLGLSAEAAFGRMPPPGARAASTAPVTPAPAAVRSSESVDHLLAVLRQAAFVGLYGSFEAPDADRSSAIAGCALLRRYDVDFRIDGCGQGLRAVNLVGDECGGARLKWTFQGSAAGPGGARNFMMDDAFVFDGEGRNQFRGSGGGRMIAMPSADGRFGVDAIGNVTGGTGIFDGVQGTYVLSGTFERGCLNLQFTLQLMDPNGSFQTGSELDPLNGTQPADRSITCLALLGEPDPDQPVQTSPGGATVHALLRAVHTEFDRGSGYDRLRSVTTVGPIIARWRSQVSFGASEGSRPAKSAEAIPIRLHNIVITFCDGAGGTLEASINDGSGFAMQLPGVSAPLLRIGGFGALTGGSGRFANAKGIVSLVSAISLTPPALSNLYLIHLVDPDGAFRC
ncbi:MAG TPA: amidase family protein [Bryobacteraceae bacterium]